MASIMVTTSGSSSTTSSSSSSQTMTVLREATAEAKSTSTRTFGSSMTQTFSSITSIDGFLDFIASERLKSMPHRGSTWDRVLAYAAYFASQTQLFSHSTGGFISHASEASRVIWSNLQLLLQNGQIDVLERLFIVYYNVGLTMSSLHPYSELFTSSIEIQQHLSLFFSHVVRLVVGMASQFGQASSGSVGAISNEIYTSFGGLIDSTYASRDLILNLMWAASVKAEIGSSAYTIDIEAIRAFLSPSDRIVRSLVSSSAGTTGFRAEHTCEWMQSHLTSFIRSKENVFLIQGKAGSGKTYLSGWIAERLQRSEGRKSNYDVVSFAVQKDVCTQTSLVAVAKSILLQLLDRNVGNATFYRVITDIFTQVAKAQRTEDVESALWRAVDAGLHGTAQTMIVVDGLDQLEGGEPSALKLLDRLYMVGSKHAHVKAIALGQPLSKAAPNQTRSLTIEASMTRRDIQSQVQHILASASEFRNLSMTDRERIVQRLSTGAEGSFLWADLSLSLLRREKSSAGILQTLEALPKTLPETFKRLSSAIDLKATDTRSLLAWILAAQRPLTLEEIKVFFEIDLGSCSHKPRFSNVERDIVNAVGPVVSVVNGCVRFKHDAIRAYFLEKASSVKDFSNTGDFPFMEAEAHYDLSTRCLAYVKLFVTRRVNPSFDPLQANVVVDVFGSYPAFEYASTYWMLHFLKSPMFDKAGKHKLVPEFRACFPDSTLLALIEGSVWPTQAVDWYELALHIRQTIVGQQSMSVLQNTINCARTFELISVQQKAVTYWFQSYTLTTTLLSEQTDILVKIATAYLTCSSSVTITEKNDVAVQRESMLKRVIAVYKTDFGASHTVTVKYLRMLADLYTSTKQYDAAVTVWTELYEIYVQKYGEHNSETTAIFKTLETTTAKSSRKEEITKITERRNKTTQKDIVAVGGSTSTGTSNGTSTTTATREVQQDTYKQYEARGDYASAESSLVEQWRSASEQSSRSASDSSLTKRRFDATTEYIQFLKRRNRHDEARSILQGVYAEVNTSTIKSESTALSIQKFAQEMRSLDMLKTARSIFSSLSSYYSKSGQSSSSQATSVSRELEETSEEIVQQTAQAYASTSTSSTSTSTTSQSSLSEAFESLTTLSSSTSSARYTSIIKTGQQLSVSYLRQKQFSESFRVSSEALAIMWPYFITRQGTVRLPNEYRAECVELALRMGECAWSQKRQVSSTEDIYLTVYKATKNTVKVTDDLYSLAAQTLTDFYDQTYQYRKFISVSREVYEDQKTVIGATSPVTVKTAYRIATYCNEQGLTKEAEPFYLDLYTVLVKGDDVPVQAIPAVEALLAIYYDDARWEVAEKLVKGVWATWTKRGVEARFSTELVERTYETYSHILREVKKVSYEEQYTLAKTYRETSRKVFGERNELTLKATMEFAAVCERSEAHRKESLSVYEEVCSSAASMRSASSSSSSSTTTTTTTSTSSALMQSINMARKTLARLYVSESATSESAAKFVAEEHQQTASAYGSTDQRSIASLSQLVEVNSKQQKAELTTQSTRMLQTAVVDTIVKEKNSEALIQSASSLAESYKKLGQTETAWELLREIRRQVITGSYTTNNKFKFSVEGTDRRSYVFIIAFGQALSGIAATSNFSALMADLMTETLLYQAYHKAVSSKAKFEVTFDHGVRLAQFYQARQRGEDYNRMRESLLDLFATTLGASKTSTTLKDFFDLVMHEVFEGHFDADIPTIVAQRVLTAMKASKFQEAYEYALYCDKYAHMQGGWRSTEKVSAGFAIALHLMGRSGTPKVSDAKLYAAVVDVSRAILAEILRASRDMNVRFISMDMAMINDIVALLGEQQNYIDLEWLLSELWSSRTSSSSKWSSTTIVWIGRRLVEVRFATGGRDAGIHLCEDIAYNTRRVWGVADPVTVQLFELLASLYAAAGEHAKALAVYEDVLRQSLIAVDELGEVEPAQGAELAKSQLELMRRAYQRNGGWGADKDAATYKDLFAQLQASFGGEKAFAGASSPDKWSAKDKSDAVGVWTKPATFEFVNASDLKHKNQLGKQTGLVSNGNGYRSTSYSYSTSTSTSTVNGKA